MQPAGPRRGDRVQVHPIGRAGVTCGAAPPGYGREMGPEETASNSVLNELGAKLDSLDLTTPERAALDAILARAEEADAEVEGFGVVFEVETTFKGTDEELQLTDVGQRMGRALGFDIRMNPYIGETEKNAR